MSQLILYQANFGILLATDSRAVEFTPSGEPRYFTLTKLYPLNPMTVLATVGAGYGQRLCEAFQQRIRQLPRARGEDITELAFHFFQEGLQARTAQDFEHGNPELQRVYFAIAGAIHEDTGSSPGFVVYASDHRTDPLHPLATGHFVCIPRQLSLETRLQRLAADQTSWEEVEEHCTRFLQRMALASEDIGPPFLFTRISGDGILTRVLEMEEDAQ